MDYHIMYNDLIKKTVLYGSGVHERADSIAGRILAKWREIKM